MGDVRTRREKRVIHKLQIIPYKRIYIKIKNGCNLYRDKTNLYYTILNLKQISLFKCTDHNFIPVCKRI